MTTRLAVIIPTIGRCTMEWAVSSVSLRAERVVVADGEYPYLVSRTLPNIELADGPHRDWGAAARNAGVALAHAIGATHIAYLDDDDAYVPGAVDKIVSWIEETPDAVHIGRMVRASDGWLWWSDPTIRYGNIGSPMIVAPVNAAFANPWEPVYDADWRHARDVAANRDVVWHEDVIAVVRPWGEQEP